MATCITTIKNGANKGLYGHSVDSIGISVRRIGKSEWQFRLAHNARVTMKSNVNADTSMAALIQAAKELSTHSGIPYLHNAISRAFDTLNAEYIAR